MLLKLLKSTYIFCLLYLFLGFTNNSLAATDPIITKPIKGSVDSFHVNAESYAKDFKYFSLSAKERSEISNNSILNVVGVGIDEESNVFIRENFTVEVTLQITTYDQNEDSSGSFTKKFIIHYDTSSNVKILNFVDTTFYNAFALKVKITGIDSGSINWQVSKVLKVENQITATRNYRFDCNMPLSEFSTTLIADDNELMASWQFPSLNTNPGVTEFDLEWAWIDESFVNNYKYGSSYSQDLIFTNNATRVSITSSNYKIPLLYDDTGRIFVRVRPIQITTSGQRIEGKWTWIFNDINQLVLSPNPVYFSFLGHENNLNWQATTSFAEEGKSKSVVQYFDGSLRSRQTVTKDNSTNRTIVAETMYDYQGRAVIQLLPMPTLNTAISYIGGFNQAIGYDEYPKSVYDKLNIGQSICSSPAKAFNTNFGSAQYYSAKNTLDTIDNTRKYVPDATGNNPDEGYPFTETRYSPDGKILMQSGVGLSHQIGSGHETKYFSEVPGQDELDALFGTDVGIASHYTKNYVKDANGQFSVSYVDMHGRTIATALVGSVPRSINDSLMLDSLQNGEEVYKANQLIDQETNIVIDTNIISSKPLIVTNNNTIFSFDYSLSPNQLSILSCNGESFCYDCMYTLEFSITSDCSQDRVYYDTIKNFTLGQYINNCNNGNANQGFNKHFEITLNEGSYTITKKLTLSTQARAAYLSQFLQRDSCKKFADFYTQELQSLLDNSNCHMTCESCMAALGDSLSGFISNYSHEMNISKDSISAYTLSQLTASYNEAMANCKRFCVDSIDGLDLVRNIRSIMLQDMTPPYGQYAKLNDSTQNPPILYQRKNYNIFKTNDFTNYLEGYGGSRYHPDFIRPKQFSADDQTLLSTGSYFDELNYPYNILSNITPKAFSDRFKTSWANQLLVHHPEFKKLQLSENELKSAYIFEALIKKDTTWAQAVSHDYVQNLVNLDPFFSGVGAVYKRKMLNGNYIEPNEPSSSVDLNFDPVVNGIFRYIKPSKYASSSQQSSFQQVYVSMWQVALSTVYCREKTPNPNCDPNYTNPATQMGCLLNPSYFQPRNDFNEGCISDKDWAWKNFRNLYLTERRKLISAYLNENARPSLLPFNDNFDEHYQMRFINYANPQSVFDNFNITGTGDIGNIINAASSNLNNGYSQAQVYQMNQFDSACTGYATMWFSQLKSCPNFALYIDTSHTWYADSVWLVSRLIGICKNGADESHFLGSSSVKPGNAFVISGQEYHEFPEVINEFFTNKGILNPTSECYDWMISAPSPYDKQRHLNSSYSLTKPDSCACQRINDIKLEWESAVLNHSFTGTFSSYMSYRYGTVISNENLNILTALCTGNFNCNLLENPIEIPPALQCQSSAPLESPKTCISCSEYEHYKNDFNTRTGQYAPYSVPQSQNEINYNNAFADFMNHQTGFQKTWTEYVVFQNTCNTQDSSFNCNKLDSLLNTFLASAEYLQNPTGLSCVQLFVDYFNNYFQVTRDYSYWVDLFSKCGTELNVCKEKITCNTFDTIIKGFYRQNGPQVFKNSNCQFLFVNYFNSQLNSNYNYAQLEGLYDYTCKNECGLNICNFPNQFLLRSVYDSFKVIHSQPWNLLNCQSEFANFFNNYFGLPSINIPAYNFQEILGLYSTFLQKGCVPDLSHLCDPPYSCNDIDAILNNFLTANQTNDSLTNCQTSFSNYFNQSMGTNYSYLDLFNLYWNICHIQLSVCSNSKDCMDIILFASKHSSLASNIETCHQEFLLHFNAEFGTTYSNWEDLFNLYDSCNYNLNNICKSCILTIDCESFDAFVTKFKSNYPDPASQLERNCEDYFAALFNEKFYTNYSFAELNTYSLSKCNKELEVCNTDCSAVDVFISDFLNKYNGLKIPESAKQDLFTFEYNMHFLKGVFALNSSSIDGSGPTEISSGNTSDPKVFNPKIGYEDILIVINSCDSSGFTLAPNDIININDPQVLLSLKQVYYIIHPNGLPDDCQNDFQSWFNKVMKIQLTYSNIMTLYNSVCGLNAGYICDLPTEEKQVASVYVDIPGLVSLSPNLPPLLCGFNESMPNNYNINNDPCSDISQIAFHFAQEKYELYLDSLRDVFDMMYYNKCMGAKDLESFIVSYKWSEYHYTLYYYDQAGNLIKTVPPSGVNKLSDADVAIVKQKRKNVLQGQSEANNIKVPAHNLVTQYRYNTLNQVVAQSTPDGGVSKFYYDRLGRLVVSQNAKQAPHHHYSYTLYDELGRITEVGELTNETPITQEISQNGADADILGSLANWLQDKPAKQITRTFYDKSYIDNNGLLCPQYLCQANLRNRVSYTAVYPTGTPGRNGEHSAATYYSYDIHGNVCDLLQDYGYVNVESNAMNLTGNRFKKINYNYDLISGKVNAVNYQPGQPDAFYHRYSYDAENRLTLVETSNDNIIWEKDARYSYYKHGPLSRTIIGDLQVQGIDYAYTLQGWLKGINSNAVGDGTFDMGRDGKVGSMNSNVARDVYGLSLNYFEGDYKAVGGQTANPFVTNPYNLLSNDGFVTAKPLFNGNIASMVVNIPKLGDAKIYGYKYDQLNRLTGMDAYNGLNNSTNVFTPAASDDYKERFSYDPNGNILSLVRNGTTQGSRPLLMDSLTYQYEKNTAGQIISNKLRYVHDKISDLNYTEDIDSQTPLTLSAVQSEHLPSQSNDNYQYDAIGNLTKDVKEGILNITWNVYGKIEKIEKDSGIVIQYKYDAGGNRIGKIVNGKETWYVRDAQGNVMGVYSKESSVNNGNLSRIEAHMYGSSRLGMYTRPIDVQQPSLINTWERGWKLYEGTNHLGNVLLTISDKKIAHNAGNGLIDYYSADIVTANDYYSGGMGAPSRKYSSSSQYRYGFNGKEKLDEIKGDGNSLDFGARIYDPRIGIWQSTDPLQIKHPNITPYAAFNDNPIYFKDPDGKDGIASITKGEGTKKKPHIVTVTANYYYSQATETQITAMKSVQSELAGANTVEKDGQFYKLVINVNFIKSEDPVASAKKDVGVNRAQYGNVLKIQDGDGGEFGDANNERIRVFENKVSGVSSQFREDNEAASYQAVFRNVLKEEVLHNLGGLHQDEGALPSETSYTIGSSSLTEKEKPAQENSYTKGNAAAIFNRIDKPLGSDAKEDPKNKKGEVIEPRLRDEKGTVGQVKTDIQKTP